MDLWLMTIIDARLTVKIRMKKSSCCPFIKFLLIVCILGFSDADNFNLYARIYPYMIREEVTKQAGESAVVTCRAEEVNPNIKSLKVQWSDPQHRSITSTTGRIYVEQHGPSVQKLYITDIKSSDEGAYTCAASLNETSGSMSTSNSFDLNVYKPVGPVIQRSTLTVELGKDAHLSCGFYETEPTVTRHWILPNGIHSTDRHSQTDGGLLIEEVTEADDGVYACIAKNSQTEEIEQEQIKLTIEPESFKIRFRPSNSVIFRSAGGALSVTCLVEDLGYMMKNLSINWIDSQGSVINSTTGRMYVDADRFGEKKLYLTDIQASDAGTYTCFIEIITDSQTVFPMFRHKTFELVLYKPVRAVVSRPEITPHSGTDVLLECVGEGTSRPKLRWILPRGIRMSTHHNVTDEGLLIRGVTESDAGVYVCSAESDSTGEIHREDIKLTVLPKPKTEIQLVLELQQQVLQVLDKISATQQRQIQLQEEQLQLQRLAQEVPRKNP